MSNVVLAFGLTLFAGLATGIGSAIAFAAKRSSYRFLSISTGFSAGVMLYVSFMEIMPKGTAALRAEYGDYWSAWIGVASFFGGLLLIALIDNLIPSAENPHEMPSESASAALHKDGEAPPGYGDHHKLFRVGLFTALAIGIHNFPEGLATFLSALEDPKVGAAIAVAIAIHNIPEGMSVSVPIFFATGNRRKAFIYSFLSGLFEPLGALLGYLGILFFLGGDNGGIPSHIMGYLFGGVAGIMVYVSLDELLPTSRAYGKGHDSLLGLCAGMFVMALSLLLMK
jgi:ZIP family zinc transporter